MNWNPFKRIRTLLHAISLQMARCFEDVHRLANQEHRETRARLLAVEKQIGQVLDLLRGKTVTKLSLSVGEPVNIKPPYQRVRAVGYDAAGYSPVRPLAGAYPWSVLTPLMNSVDGRRRLSVAMKLPPFLSPVDCLGAVLKFCGTMRPAELEEAGEPGLWVKRLLARVANVRPD